jgi:hypothetical protein
LVVPLVLPEPLALLGILVALLEQLVKQEIPDHREPQAEPLVPPELEDHQDQLVLLVLEELPVFKVVPGELQELQEPLVQLV